jgi:hypothetical protein
MQPLFLPEYPESLVCSLAAFEQHCRIPSFPLLQRRVPLSSSRLGLLVETKVKLERYGVLDLCHSSTLL